LFANIVGTDCVQLALGWIQIDWLVKNINIFKTRENETSTQSHATCKNFRNISLQACGNIFSFGHYMLVVIYGSKIKEKYTEKKLAPSMSE
jgi:nicotinic acid mononucleotide adenylyltransferase